MTTNRLKAILESSGLPTSGTKDERIRRIIASGMKPSECLDDLSNDELYQLCKGLPGAKVSGTKQQRAERVIEYFASLVTKDVSHEASPGEVYYEYLVELAHRDRENLLANKVIKKTDSQERVSCLLIIVPEVLPEPLELPTPSNVLRTISEVFRLGASASSSV